MCQDSEGRSTNYCDERVKPSEAKSCDSGPCPLWNYGIWGEVSIHDDNVAVLKLFGSGSYHTVAQEQTL